MTRFAQATPRSALSRKFRESAKNLVRFFAPIAIYLRGDLRAGAVRTVHPFPIPPALILAAVLATADSVSLSRNTIYVIRRHKFFQKY
jgi:hypothetical protein